MGILTLPALRKIVLGVWVLGVAAFAPAKRLSANVDSPSTPEQRGERIYRDGMGASGNPIALRLGQDERVSSRVVVVCANCHGRDGRGRREGAVTPSDIRWEVLTNAIVAALPGARTRSSYTARTFVRALTLGLDPDGTKLSPIMPRFELAAGDVADLLAYIKSIGSLRDPGVTSTSVRIGVIVPPIETAPELGNEITHLMNDYFGSLNKSGGIHRRDIEVHPLVLPLRLSDRSRAVEEFVSNENPFAMVGSTLAGNDEQEVHRVFASNAIPIVGAMSPSQRWQSDWGSSPYYLFPGMADQARGLLAHLESPEDRSRSQVVVFDRGDVGEGLFRSSIRTIAEQMGYASVIEVSGQPGIDDLAATLSKAAGITRRSLFLTQFSRDDGPWIRSFRQRFSAAKVMTLAERVDASLFTQPMPDSGKMYLSFPLLSSDQSPLEMREYQALALRLQLSDTHRTTHLAVLASARLFAEALSRCGPDFSRERLKESLEELSDFQSGLCPPLNYQKGRRVGTGGIHIVEADFSLNSLNPLGWFSVFAP